MWTWLDDTLMKFKPCFSRKASFSWFIIIIIGLMIRSEHLGITSIIRELNIMPSLYTSLIHFFHADSWNLNAIRIKWIQIVRKSNCLYTENHMPILIGDGVKQLKEAKKMPAVKKHHQESENSSKAEYIFGHLFGAVGVLAGTASKQFCVPLSVTIQDGAAAMRKWENESFADESHVIQMIRDASLVASILKPSILLLDRYFLTVPALNAWLEEEENFGHQLLTLVTKAKSNAVAFELPIPQKGRGRKAKKGKRVKFEEVFKNCESEFVETSVMMYGKLETVKYLCKDLLWGQKLYRKLRFVLVKYGNTESILVSTDLTLSPEQIIRLYCCRMKIESTFRELKQVIGGFSYHFWNKSMPKLNKYAKNKESRETLEAICNVKEQNSILSTLKAIEGYVMFSCIAIGLLQIIAIKFSKELNVTSFRWLRTQSNSIPSEATVAHFMRKTIFIVFQNMPHLGITRFILPKQNQPPISSDSHIA